ncbi:MAG TPA: hypothetical protein VEX18_09710, partial [Polyangiaceae bacterium]|nr:hypothetical protein [Polyangiaceae bacterium]
AGCPGTFSVETRPDLGPELLARTSYSGLGCSTDSHPRESTGWREPDIENPNSRILSLLSLVYSP